MTKHPKTTTAPSYTTVTTAKAPVPPLVTSTNLPATEDVDTMMATAATTAALDVRPAVDATTTVPKQAMASVPASVATGSNRSTSSAGAAENEDRQSKADDGKGTGPGLLTGAVVGGVLIGCLIAGAVVWNKRSTANQNLANNNNNDNTQAYDQGDHDPDDDGYLSVQGAVANGVVPQPIWLKDDGGKGDYADVDYEKMDANG
jgi:hypothetical protein